MNDVTRRHFLIAASSTALLAACSSSSGDGSEAVADGVVGEDLFLIPAFPDGVNAPSIIASGSEQRLPFVLRDEIDILRDTAPDTAEIIITRDGVQVAGGAVTKSMEGLITPYYAVHFTPESPGDYLATLEGAVLEVPFTVVDPSEIKLVQVGDQLRPVDTATIADPGEVDPLCTRAVPCPFHELNLNDAIGSGRPTMFLMATPGYCQTDICGPVVDLLIEAVEGRDDINVIHAEIYNDPSIFDTGAFPPLSEPVALYGLDFEPQLIVADANDTVVARLDLSWDRSEMQALVDSL